MANFTPVSAAIGGALIGLAAAMLMLFAGRIAGISGILGGALATGATDRGWRLATRTAASSADSVPARRPSRARK